MAKTITIPNIVPRHYQEPTFRYFDDTTKPGLRAVECWARRCGKDLTYMSLACKAALQRKGMYLHFLPEATHARRTLWDGFTIEGERLIDIAFPRELRKATSESEMRIEFVNGASWQLGGSDQYDRWVGSNPVGIVYSEAALAQPKAFEIMRPILKVNGGWAAYISTPRGYNAFYQLLELAKKEKGWHWSHVDAVAAGVMTEQDIEDEIRQGMPPELARQEYRCDFSAANVGAILGRYIEAADREGRIKSGVYDPSGALVDVSADIGFRDSTAFWFWQPWIGAFGLAEYDEDSGLDAQQWIERLAGKPYRYGTIYLPHDARAKTFATKHSVIEQFLQAKRDGRLKCEHIKIVPKVATKDRINAARTVLPRCRFDSAACAQGLMSLREWSYAWNEDRKVYSKEPNHNWSSHGSDAFTYGALMMAELMSPAERAAEQPRTAAPEPHRYTLEQLWADRERDSYGRSRIA